MGQILPYAALFIVVLSMVAVAVHKYLRFGLSLGRAPSVALAVIAGLACGAATLWIVAPPLDSPGCIEFTPDASGRCS